MDRALEEAGLPPLQRSAWVEVDLDTLTANASALHTLVSPAIVAAVVKADGYGHGLEMAARCAAAGGADWLCVANAAEAERLRDDGYPGRAFVLYPVPPRILPRMARLGIDVTVGSTGGPEGIAGALGPDDPVLSVHVEVDTGMTRGGVPPEDAVAVAVAIASSSSMRLAGTWTHLAAPEDPASVARQLERFEAVLAGLAAHGIDPGVVHAAASGGLLASTASRHALVRPGLAFYGLHPDAGDPLPSAVRPAIAVKALPVRVAEVPEGTSVGYAGMWTATRPSRIATLPLGYADGWARASSPGTVVAVEGRSAPVVGRVSSDAITVDVTDVPAAGETSEFTLLGRHPAVAPAAVAAVRRTISWEVLQQLGARLTRVYTSGGRPVAIRLESTTRWMAAPGAAVPAYPGGG